MPLSWGHGERRKNVVEFSFDSIGSFNTGSPEQVGPNLEDILFRIWGENEIDHPRC
jgi:hypothetical protein